MVGEYGNVTFGYECVAFGIGLPEIRYVVLEQSYITTILHQAVGVDYMLPVVFEFTYPIAASSLDVVD